MSEQCKKYACDLLDQCRSSEEVIAVLNKDTDSDTDDDNDEVDCEKLTLSRLKLALKYEQKQVGVLHLLPSENKIKNAPRGDLDQKYCPETLGTPLL